LDVEEAVDLLRDDDHIVINECQLGRVERKQQNDNVVLGIVETGFSPELQRFGNGDIVAA
jgi:hypothetical protein